MRGKREQAVCAVCSGTRAALFSPSCIAARRAATAASSVLGMRSAAIYALKLSVSRWTQAESSARSASACSATVCISASASGKLLPRRQAGNHCRERRRKCAGQCRYAAAARCRRRGCRFGEKFGDRAADQFAHIRTALQHLFKGEILQLQVILCAVDERLHGNEPDDLAAQDIDAESAAPPS